MSTAVMMSRAEGQQIDMDASFGSALRNNGLWLQIKI
jgi:hypothetical protein